MNNSSLDFPEEDFYTKFMSLALMLISLAQLFLSLYLLCIVFGS